MTKSDHQALFDEFAAWCARHDITPHKAGLVLAGDHKLRARIQNGSLRYATGAKIREKMADLDRSSEGRVGSPPPS